MLFGSSLHPKRHKELAGVFNKNGNRTGNNSNPGVGVCCWVRTVSIGGIAAAAEEVAVVVEGEDRVPVAAAVGVVVLGSSSSGKWEQ